MWLIAAASPFPNAPTNIVANWNATGHLRHRWPDNPRRFVVNTSLPSMLLILPAPAPQSWCPIKQYPPLATGSMKRK